MTSDATRPDGVRPPFDTSAPAFTAPWQAQIFAMVERLKDARVIGPAEWSGALGARLAALPVHSSTQDDVWRCWVAALEALLMERRIAAPLQLASLRQAWRVAAEKTPHGQPVALGALAYRWAGLTPSAAPAGPVPCASPPASGTSGACR